MIAPVFLEGNWQQDYEDLLIRLQEALVFPPGADLHFEIISHRFTIRARTLVNEVFPKNQLPMDEKNGRQFKYGQFGYGKYVYDLQRLDKMKSFFSCRLGEMFPQAMLEYII